MIVTMKITYQVYCRGIEKYERWIPISPEYDTREEAEERKSLAAGRRTLDIFDKRCIYEIREKYTRV